MTETTFTRWVPSPIPQFLGEQVPVHDVQQERCGFEYQDGAAPSGSALCRCGTFAVGLCVVCSQGVCGRGLPACGGMGGGKLLCSEHLSERRRERREVSRRYEAARERAAAEAEQAAERRRQEQSRRWERDVVAFVEPIDDPVERTVQLVRCVWLVSWAEIKNRGLPTVYRLGGKALYERLLPDEVTVGGKPLDDALHDPPWDHSAIARWFRAAMAGTEPPDVLRYEHDVLWWTRRFEVPGWRLRGASTRSYVQHWDTDQIRRHADAFVSADGGHHHGRLTEDERFNAAGLIRMAELAGLAPPPEAPSGG